MKLNFFLSLIYAIKLHYCDKNGKKAKLSNRMYHLILEKGAGDHIIRTSTNGQRLYCTFAHQLPFYQKQLPYYDRQLSKLCHYLHNELRRTINIIDVGANIGDTVLNINLKDAFYLCVEGNKNYASLIELNLKNKYSYSLEECYLTDKSVPTDYRFEVANGTNRLLPTNDSTAEGILLQTLNQLIDSKYKDINFDLIKVDTDGFDFKVIRGARKYIEKCHPFLFFEWDKKYCKEQGEDPLSIFPLLEDLGYSECILFDNYGKLFDTVKTSDINKLEKHIENTIGQGLPYYYDVLAINNTCGLSANQLHPIFA